MADNTDFLSTYTPLANDIATQTGLDPSVVLGIIHTETGGGAHVLGNNIFGITPPGGVARYPDVQTAANAFVTLMQSRRYAGVANAPDPASQAAALVKSGYNTANPAYASIITQKAANFGKQLGYQDDLPVPPVPPTDAAPSVSINATNSEPVTPPAAPATPPTQPASPPTAQPASAPASASSEVDKALSDPALQPNTGSAVAPAKPGAAKPQTEVDKAVNDPALQTTGTTTTTTTAAPKTGVGIGGAPAESAVDTLKRWFGAGGPPAQPSALANVITSPDAQAADRPAGEAPPSLEDVRARIQQGDIAVINALKPGPDAGPIEQTIRHALMVPPHLLAAAAEWPIDKLIGLGQGITTGGVLTIDPAGNKVRLTPEAQAAGTIGLGGSVFGGRDLQFSGRNPLVRELPPPPTAAAGGAGTWRPVQPGEVFQPGGSYRMNVATGQQEVLEPTTPTTPGPQPAAAPTGPAPSAAPRAGPTGESAASIAASGGYRPAPEAPPQPTGAQVAPAYEAIHTPAEEAAYRATAEGKKLLEPQIIGEPDLNQYIPGETVNNAEREQTVKTARELKELGIRVPEASQMDKAAAESNNTARTIYLDNTTKGPVEINNRITQRQTDIAADKATVFAPDNVTGPVNLQPVIDHMQQVLDQPFNRQNTALQQAYRPWLERMRALPDAAIENPEEAWGLRYDMDQQTDKFAQRDNPNMHRVAHQLADAADTLDGQIEKVAPGYADMLAKYKEHSRAIDEMQVLQGAKDKFRGPGQKLTYNDFQRYMKNVVDSRMTPSTDLNSYKAISDQNMQRLWNIRDSLRRTASAQELAKASGSDTMPNIIDALKGIGKMGGTAALHAYVGAHLGPGGNLALQSLGAIGRELGSRRTIRRATQQMNRLLRPSEPLRAPPGQENPLNGAPAP